MSTTTPKMDTTDVPRRLREIAATIDRHPWSGWGTDAERKIVADDLRVIASKLAQHYDPQSTAAAADIILATQDTDTLRDLLKVWAGSAHSRPELTDHDRVRVLESAFTRFLRIEAAHEGDGR